MTANATSSTAARCPRILIAEDNYYVRSVVLYTLTRANYLVESACDGMHALQLIEASAEPFDALVTDHDMPRLNGLDLVSIIHTRQTKLPVVVFSGSIDHNLGTRYRALGVKHIVEKPGLPHALINAVRDVLGTGPHGASPTGALAPAPSSALAAESSG